MRETLSYIEDIIPELKIYSINSGTKVFNWTVPDEWNLSRAFIEDDQGNKVVDFNNNNLHVVGYSKSIDKKISLLELNKNLHSLPSQPKAIPYVTSYYVDQWGFCLTHEQRIKLKEGVYRVCIDSEKKPGVLNYGEIIIPGESKKEVLLSTYVCHPSMANNELSGPVVVTAIAKWLGSLDRRRYTYRIIFIPETIGAMAYLSKNIEAMKRNTVAGFVVTCIGDERSYSYVPSRQGDTLSDRVARCILDGMDVGYKEYSYLDRGSDERQYCSPGVDLPVASVMRSKYMTFPEYHTSLDDLNFVTESGLMGGFEVYKEIIELLEENYKYKAVFLCEPQLGKYNLYSDIGIKTNDDMNMSSLLNFLAFADGENDLIEISKLINESMLNTKKIADTLSRNKLIYPVK